MFCNVLFGATSFLIESRNGEVTFSYTEMFLKGVFCSDGNGCLIHRKIYSLTQKTFQIHSFQSNLLFGVSCETPSLITWHFNKETGFSIFSYFLLFPLLYLYASLWWPILFYAP